MKDGHSTIHQNCCQVYKEDEIGWSVLVAEARTPIQPKGYLVIAHDSTETRPMCAGGRRCSWVRRQRPRYPSPAQIPRPTLGMTNLLELSAHRDLADAIVEKSNLDLDMRGLEGLELLFGPLDQFEPRAAEDLGDSDLQPLAAIVR